MRDNDIIVDKEVLPALHESNSLENGSWRVKIFELDAENNWINQGTGIASIPQDVLFPPYLRVIITIYM
jgi:hypothetical protein